MNSLFLVLFFIFSICFECSSAIEQTSAVLDSDDNAVEAGSKYYVVSWDNSVRGLTLSSYSSFECPGTTVSMEACDNHVGSPVSFHPAAATGDGVIRLSKSLNIKFEDVAVSACANSTVWRLGHLDAYTRSFLITINGVEGNPGCRTAANWFKIEQGEYPGRYKFLWNPRDVCSNTAIGFGLSIGSAFGERPMLAADFSHALEVRFVKHHDAIGKAVN